MKQISPVNTICYKYELFSNNVQNVLAIIRKPVYHFFKAMAGRHITVLHKAARFGSVLPWQSIFATILSVQIRRKIATTLTKKIHEIG